MSVRKHYYLACTDCNNQYYSPRLGQFVVCESAREVRREAKADGWWYTRVENGSMWDVCPRCQLRWS